MVVCLPMCPMYFKCFFLTSAKFFGSIGLSVSNISPKGVIGLRLETL